MNPKFIIPVIILVVTILYLRERKRNMEYFIYNRDANRGGEMDNTVLFNTYYINIDGMTEREDTLLQSLSGVDVGHILRVSANTPKDLDDKAEGCKMTDNERACLSSHKKAINMFLNDENEWGLILEDDVFVNVDNDTYNRVKKMISLYSDITKPQMFILGYCGMITKDTSDIDLVKTEYGFGGSFAYLINNKAAKILLEESKDKPADDFISSVHGVEKVKIKVNPKHYLQNDGFTPIEGIFFTKNDTSTIREYKNSMGEIYNKMKEVVGGEKLNKICKTIYMMVLDPLYPIIIQMIDN